MTQPVYHLALADAWAQAFVTGEYRASTVGKTLAEVGFIHLSHAHQLQGVADAFYRDRADVMLLTIDPARVGAELRDEAVPGTDEVFPHLYGPLPVIAVMSAQPVALHGDGRLDLGHSVGPS